MSIGARIYTRISRPDPKLLARLVKVPVANLDDNMGRLYAVDAGIKPLNKTPLCGPAFTVKCPSGDNLMFHKALDLAQPGDILVISCVGGGERSLSGGMMVEYAIAKKLGGFVVEGMVRDLEDQAAADFPVYARGIQANGPYKNGPGEINVPVAVGGQVVMPGDILVGDADGLIVIPAADAEAVCAAGEATLAKETIGVANTRAGKPANRQWVDDKINALGIEYMD